MHSNELPPFLAYYMLGYHFGGQASLNPKKGGVRRRVESEGVGQKLPPPIYGLRNIQMWSGLPKILSGGTYCFFQVPTGPLGASHKIPRGHAKRGKTFLGGIWKLFGGI